MLRLTKQILGELTSGELVEVVGGATYGCQPLTGIAPCYPTYRCESEIVCV